MAETKMKPSDIIEKFQLDTSSDENNFLVAADYCEEHGLFAMAKMLREGRITLIGNQFASFIGYGERDQGSYGLGHGYGDGFGYGESDRGGGGFGSGEIEPCLKGEGFGYGYASPNDKLGRVPETSEIPGCGYGNGVGNGAGFSDQRIEELENKDIHWSQTESRIPHSAEMQITLCQIEAIRTRDDNSAAERATQYNHYIRRLP